MFVKNQMPIEEYLIRFELWFSFQETMLSINNLVTDCYFDAFSRPLINGKREEKIPDTGPQLRSVFAEDRELQELIQDIGHSIRQSFETIENYIEVFREINYFYVDNETVTKDSLRREREGNLNVKDTNYHPRQYEIFTLKI